ncbi:MAG TPA: NB-ARC domain-containing protein [Pyrinomonadaceae bacterium]|nr:NB-ARC domain-containing protein [Pyrinomonadaceae bacterium]
MATSAAKLLSRSIGSLLIPVVGSFVGDIAAEVVPERVKEALDSAVRTSGGVAINLLSDHYGEYFQSQDALLNHHLARAIVGMWERNLKELSGQMYAEAQTRPLSRSALESDAGLVEFLARKLKEAQADDRTFMLESIFYNGAPAEDDSLTIVDAVETEANAEALLWKNLSGILTGWALREHGLPQEWDATLPDELRDRMKKALFQNLRAQLGTIIKTDPLVRRGFMYATTFHTIALVKRLGANVVGGFDGLQSLLGSEFALLNERLSQLEEKRLSETEALRKLTAELFDPDGYRRLIAETHTTATRTYEVVERTHGVAVQTRAGVQEIQADVQEIKDELRQRVSAALTPSGEVKVDISPNFYDESHFKGRREQLLELEAILVGGERGRKVCCIVGDKIPMGVGKSTLAHAFGHLHKESFPDGVISRRADGESMHEVVNEFVGRLVPNIPAGVPSLSLFKSVFAHRRMLLVFDNVEDHNLVAGLLPNDEDAYAVIITARAPDVADSLPTPFKLIRLPPLGQDDAVELLWEWIGRARVLKELSAAEKIVGFLDGLPLGIKLVGQMLKGFRVNSSLADFLTELEDEKRGLRKVRVGGNVNDPDLSLFASINLSLKGLSPECVGFFCKLSVLSERGFSTRAGGVFGDESLLEELFGRGLVNNAGLSRTGKRRYILHQLILRFARLKAGEFKAEGAADLLFAARLKHAHWYLKFSDRASENEVLDEIDEILNALEFWVSERTPQKYEEVARRLGIVLEKERLPRQLIQLTKIAINATHRLGHYAAEINLRISLAKQLRYVNDNQGAKNALGPVGDVIDTIYPDKERLDYEARWKNTEATALRDLMLLDEAERAARDAVECRDELIRHGDETRKNEEGKASALNTLSTILQNQADELFSQDDPLKQIESRTKLDEALSVAQESVKLRQKILSPELGHSYLSEANIYRKIARRHGSPDRLLQMAVTKADQAYQYFKRKPANTVPQAQALTVKGMALRERESYPAAIKALKEALRLEEEAHLSGIAKVKTELGRTYLFQKDYAEAIKYLVSAFEIEEGNPAENRPPNKVGLKMVFTPLEKALEANADPRAPEFARRFHRALRR